MDLGLEGKVALVSAASAGLGHAVALALAAEGARLAICGRQEGRVSEAASVIRARTGAEVLPVVADLSAPDGPQHFVEASVSHYGCVNIAVLNAGGPPSGEFVDLDEAAWRRGIDLTLMSAVNLCYAVIPHMRRAGGGRIVAITSISVKQPLANLTLSNSLRLAVLGLVKTLSNELASDGILVNAVLPGWTRTGRVTELLAARAAKRGLRPEAVEAEVVSDIPLRRLAEPEELAAAVAFLVSERASYITGAALQVDGGSIKTPF